MINYTIMGEINTSSQDHSKRRSRRSARVDLTPMVDLGFLLITFFIFSTSMSEPVAMKLFIPKDTIKDSTNIPESNTLNILVTGNNKLHYYYGSDISLLNSCRASGNEIRNIIINKKAALNNGFAKHKGLYILIKPFTTASYQEIVNLLDEMTINGIKTYFLVEPTAQEANTLTSVVQY